MCLVGGNGREKEIEKDLKEETGVTGKIWSLGVELTCNLSGDIENMVYLRCIYGPEVESG